MSAHTPGPWTLETSPYKPRVYGDRKLIAEVGNAEDVFDAWEEWTANARMIAAAPELLTALKAILHPDNEALCYFVPCDSHAMKLRDDARAAVAKATGGAS